MLLVTGLWLFAFNVANVENRGLDVSKCSFLDLSHPLSGKSPVFGNREPMRYNISNRGPYYINSKVTLPYVEENILVFNDHSGTHVDSPSHFYKGYDRIEKVKLRSTIGEACVFDISDKYGIPYALTVQDLLDWEKMNMRTVDGCILLLNTGHGKFWEENDQGRKFFGTTDDPRNVGSYNFPGFGKEVADYLLEHRTIQAVGTDCVSFDASGDLSFPAHTKFLSNISEANILGYENVANVDQLPAAGSTVFMAPAKIVDSSGAPVRAFAIGWQDNDPCRLGSGTGSKSQTMIFATMILVSVVV